MAGNDVNLCIRKIPRIFFLANHHMHEEYNIQSRIHHIWCFVHQQRSICPATVVSVSLPCARQMQHDSYGYTWAHISRYTYFLFIQRPLGISHRKCRETVRRTGGLPSAIERNSSSSNARNRHHSHAQCLLYIPTHFPLTYGSLSFRSCKFRCHLVGRERKMRSKNKNCLPTITKCNTLCAKQTCNKFIICISWQAEME